ncbi:hypothetical protein L1N85_00905 [Paenibacillus alkaliterrae]|uniref:hypothetical protein n=1 Tax=Paenibacillus alkaliterrae TaxID=320909 RepID=UPI001F3E5C25|nr:hypothetical protein [Paenibacillus alkaliterrae]MCF2936988.1 hypothetical protein [Paenibacillus alkaliterrae]
MNISQMMRSFLGEASSTDTRAMELKVGQIVRGVILQVMENNEALVQINGIQVRAKMEIPLQAGQTAMLQVQPQSNGALVALKQIDPSAAGLPEDTFKEWAKQLALPEQKWAASIVKDLRNEGVILNREVSQLFQQAAASLPSGSDAEQWMQASTAAFKRGLPMTGATIGALQQVMFGRNAHELLETLEQQLASAANTLDGEEDRKLVSQAMARVDNLLAEGAKLLRGAASAGEQPSANSINDKHTGIVARSDNKLSGNGLSAVDADHKDLNAMPQSGRGTANPSNWLGQMMKWLGVDHELQLTKLLTLDSQAMQNALVTQSSETDKTNVTAEAERNRVAAVKAGDAAGALQAIEEEGDTHSNRAAATAGKPADMEIQQPDRMLDLRNQVERASAITSPPLSMALDNSTAADPAQPVQPVQQETLKSALLTLIAADDVPPAIKETVQQLVQQITGQQLLLAPERNSSMLTHVTMFIPLNSPDGSQTASVHIQTRRGRKGELDASNCRLLFNLYMKTLGDTLVDVNVVDKIVSLNLWNDYPAIAALADASRSEIVTSLQQAGYKLLSLRTIPLPKAGQTSAEALSAAAANMQQPPDLSSFSSTRYKGVDYRI